MTKQAMTTKNAILDGIFILRARYFVSISFHIIWFQKANNKTGYLNQIIFNLYKFETKFDV